MKKLLGKSEQKFFRALNGVVEPLVRKGFLSSKLVPASLIILETTGFKSGKERSTPLWSIGVGGYRIISTARGKRSFWVKNLSKQPETQYVLGGDPVPSEAILISPDFNNVDQWELNSVLSRLVSVLQNYARQGWAFAVLVPTKA